MKPLLDSIPTCIEYIRQTLATADISTDFLDEEFEQGFEEIVIDEVIWSETLISKEMLLSQLLGNDTFRSTVATYTTNYYTILEELTLDVIADHYIVV